MSCLCGSDMSFYHCCHPIIEGRVKALSPEALMRSRYTAYAKVNIKYILKSMRGSPKERFNVKEAKLWAKKIKWQGLKVIRSIAQKDTGYVEFEAVYIENKEKHTLHEISEFKMDNGQWYYVGEVSKWPDV